MFKEWLAEKLASRLISSRLEMYHYDSDSDNDEEDFKLHRKFYT